MNISVVKKSRPFRELFNLISGIFYNNKEKYIQIPATTSLNYIDSNYKKTEIDINRIEKQDIKCIKELIMNGIIGMEDLTLEELELLNQLYIKENEQILENNRKKLDKIEKMKS
ncbi:MAG: hypothetical protein Q4D02_00360 [Clostridia bacterium]|nr:hypothetical protein [Clostridia bacterium]